jgi:hypothetical protein
MVICGSYMFQISVGKDGGIKNNVKKDDFEHIF